jgi:hypothetical protein
MDETFQSIQHMLAEIAEHLNAGTQADRSAAVLKLHRVASVATTLAFTIKPRR